MAGPPPNQHPRQPANAPGRPLGGLRVGAPTANGVASQPGAGLGGPSTSTTGATPSGVVREIGQWRYLRLRRLLLPANPAEPGDAHVRIGA